MWDVARVGTAEDAEGKERDSQPLTLLIFFFFKLILLNPNTTCAEMLCKRRAAAEAEREELQRNQSVMSF